MQPEVARAEALAVMNAALGHPWLSGLTTQQRQLMESFKLFMQQEITPEQLAVVAGRVD